MTTPWLSADTVEEISTEASSGGRFINPSKLEGEKRLRFFGPGITGFGGWTTEKKPVRYELKPEELPANLAPDLQGRIGLKRFLMGVVYDYEAQEFKILEITQRTLMEQLFKYIKDEDYGDPCNYDIKVSKTGKDKETKYSLIASPPKPASKDLVAEFSELRCDLRAVYDNEDPWAEPTA